MRLFAKRHPKLAELPSRQSWALAESTNQGLPMYLRINEGAREFAGHSELPYRFGVAVPLLEPDERGLPKGPEMEALNQIEDTLIAALEPALDGFLVLSITTSDMREFVFYVRDPDHAASAAAAARDHASRHEVQHYVEHDPTWTVYRQFA